MPVMPGAEPFFHSGGNTGVLLCHGFTGTPASLTAHGPIAQSPYARGGLRYLCIVPLPNGGERYYYEMTRADGSHELRTEIR